MFCSPQKTSNGCVPEVWASRGGQDTSEACGQTDPPEQIKCDNTGSEVSGRRCRPPSRFNEGRPYSRPTPKAPVTTRRTCFCVLSTCKNVCKRRAFVRGEYHLRTESYGFGSTQTRRRTLSACKTFSTYGLRIHHPYVRVRATGVPRACRTEEARVSTASSR
ncbi:hypothetical protein Bbelb_072900 [Branchiostoma belcheri]|nr:hypothetical protein Bbelb_072900 [Branchiostoma belcheri]